VVGAKAGRFGQCVRYHARKSALVAYNYMAGRDGGVHFDASLIATSIRRVSHFMIRKTRELYNSIAYKGTSSLAVTVDRPGGEKHQEFIETHIEKPKDVKQNDVTEESDVVQDVQRAPSEPNVDVKEAAPSQNDVPNADVKEDVSSQVYVNTNASIEIHEEVLHSSHGDDTIEASPIEVLNEALVKPNDEVSTSKVPTETLSEVLNEASVKSISDVSTSIAPTEIPREASLKPSTEVPITPSIATEKKTEIIPKLMAKGKMELIFTEASESDEETIEGDPGQSNPEDSDMYTTRG